MICIVGLPVRRWGRLAPARSELGGKRQQGDIARALDRFAEPALVLRARAGHASRQDLTALLHKRLEHFHLLVIDEVYAVSAEPAHFLLAEILPLAPARASRPARRASFAPRRRSGWCWSGFLGHVSPFPREVGLAGGSHRLARAGSGGLARRAPRGSALAPLHQLLLAF